MKFCSSCNNLLYPRENRESKTLEYACRPPCVFVERNVTDSKVFNRIMLHIQLKKLSKIMLVILLNKVFLNELVKDSSTKLEVILSDVNKVILCTYILI